MAGAAQYQDVLDRLDDEGLPARFTQTGGMNAALEVTLETGQTLLITDFADSLAWSRAELAGWSVGVYPKGDAAADGPTRFASAEDTRIEVLLSLIKDVLLPGPGLN